MPYDRSRPLNLPGPGDLADCPPPGWFDDECEHEDVVEDGPAWNRTTTCLDCGADLDGDDW